MIKSEDRCECGCGEYTNLSPEGKPRRFLRGHNLKLKISHGWIDQAHRFLSIDGHRIAEHRWVVEQREGRKLTSDEIVHHVDGNPLNNDPENLVV